MINFMIIMIIIIIISYFIGAGSKTTPKICVEWRLQIRKIRSMNRARAANFFCRHKYTFRKSLRFWY